MDIISIGGIPIADSNIIHDSTREEYRCPVGAVTCGTETLLSLKINGLHYEHVTLCVLCGETVDRIDMTAGGKILHARYTVPISEKGGGMILWYWFEIMLQGGAICYYGAEQPYSSGLGHVYQNPPPGFQITAYDEAFETPDWAKSAIMYQIFPDRFNMGDPDGVRAGIAWHQGMGRTDIELCGDWNALPVYEAKDGQLYYMPTDIFGGDLEGIRQRLSYLKELGVSLIYLNPIFESASNHRYNTGDYLKIDPILGNEASFRKLSEEAKEAGIRIILDGVFSHTGDDSVYFNKYGRYEGPGAYQSKESPHFGWYKFESYPDRYKSWWGFETLPEVDESNHDWQDFVLAGKDSVVRHWLSEGASGYRLDVADELPD